MPTTTPVSTPAESTPTMAATAIQKSNRVTRYSRRSLDVDHPEHDGVDDHGGEDRLREIREERRKEEQRQQDECAGDQRRQRRPRPRRLVQRARGEARRDGHALERPRPDVGHALSHRLLVDVDGVLVPGRERARVTGGLREPDEQQRDRGDGDRHDVVADEVEAGSSGAGNPLGTSPTSATPWAPRSNTREAEDPRGDEHQRAGDGGGQEAQAEDQPQRDHPDDHRRPVHVAERADPRPELAPRVVALRVGAGELGSSPITTSTAAPARKPVITALERKRAIHPSRSSANTRYSSPEASVIAATSSAASASARPVARTAPPPRRPATSWVRGDLARRAEERVDDRARGRRVEAVLQRHSGDPGVAEILRDDQRGDGDPGGDVAPQPPALVGTQPLEDGKPDGHGPHHLPRARDA